MPVLMRTGDDIGKAIRAIRVDHQSAVKAVIILDAISTIHDQIAATPPWRLYARLKLYSELRAQAAIAKKTLRAATEE